MMRVLVVDDVAPMVTLGPVLSGQRKPTVGGHRNLVRDDGADGYARDLDVIGQVDERDAAARSIRDQQRAVERHNGRAPEPQQERRP